MSRSAPSHAHAHRVGDGQVSAPQRVLGPHRTARAAELWLLVVIAGWIQIEWEASVMEAQAATGWVAELIAPWLSRNGRDRYAEAVGELAREEGVRGIVGAPGDFGFRWGITRWLCSLELPTTPEAAWTGVPLLTRVRPPRASAANS